MSQSDFYAELRAVATELRSCNPGDALTRAELAGVLERLEVMATHDEPEYEEEESEPKFLGPFAGLRGDPVEDE